MLLSEVHEVFRWIYIFTSVEARSRLRSLINHTLGWLSKSILSSHDERTGDLLIWIEYHLRSFLYDHCLRMVHPGLVQGHHRRHTLWGVALVVGRLLDEDGLLDLDSGVRSCHWRLLSFSFNIILRLLSRINTLAIIWLPSRVQQSW